MGSARQCGHSCSGGCLRLADGQTRVFPRVPFLISDHPGGGLFAPLGDSATGIVMRLPDGEVQLPGSRRLAHPNSHSCRSAMWLWTTDLGNPPEPAVKIGVQ